MLQPKRCSWETWHEHLLAMLGLHLLDKPGGKVAGLGCCLSNSAFLAAAMGSTATSWS